MSIQSGPQTELTWPYWPQPRQRESWDNMAPYKKPTVNGYGAAKYGGKASALSANILTPFGWRKMADINVGSRITSIDGKTQRVLAVHPQGEKQMYRIETDDGGSTRVSGDHLWTVRVRDCRRNNQNYRWIKRTTAQLIEILEADRAVYPSIPLVDPVHYSKTYPTNVRRVDPYLLGLLLGDGSITMETVVKITTSHDHIKTGIENLGYQITKVKNSNEYVFVGGMAKELRKDLDWLGLLGCGSLEKFIPDYYQFDSIDGRKQLMRGLMDTDGYVDSRGHCSYSSSSRRLAEDVQKLIWSLGGRASISVKKTDCNDNYIVHFKTSIDPEIVSLPRKKARCRYWLGEGMEDRLPKRRITSITPDGTEQCQCITVDHPSSLYVTDDFIVTHNSYNIRAICCMYGIDRPLQMLIMAREYDQLKDLHIEPIKAEMTQYIEAGLLTWNANDKQFRFTETGALLKFIQVNRASDMIRHNGKGFDIVCVDEAQQFTKFELSFIPSLCRPSAVAMAHREKLKTYIKAADTKKERNQYIEILENSFYKPKCLFCFNWGDAGHNYLVSKFWEGCSHRKGLERDLTQFDMEIDPKTGEPKENPDDFTFIFAAWQDNPKGYEDNPEYIRNLNRLPEPYRTAYKEGDPYAMSGLKYRIVDGIHDVDMDKKLEKYNGIVPEHWRLIGALDPGTASVCAFSLYAIDPDGNYYQLTDYYKKGFSFEEHAENIYHDIRHCRWTGPGQMPYFIIAGKDAFHRKSRYAIQSHNVTLADIFWDKYGLKLMECNTDRRLGAMAVANALNFRMDEDGNYTRTPNLYFATYRMPSDDGETKKIQVCKATKGELTSLKSDKHDPEDIQRGDEIEDHAFDKTKYMLLGADKPHQVATKTEERHEISDYGRIPKEKVWQKDQASEKSLNDTFSQTPLAETI